MSNNEFTIRLDPEQIQELKDYVDTQIAAALESTTPQPQPEPPAAGVSVEELADILRKMRMEGSYLHCAVELLNRPRIGPLLRSEVRRRVELPEEPPVWLMREGKGEVWETRQVNRLIRDTWIAARAELARLQEVW